MGRLGVSIDTLADMELLYDELPMETLISSFNINAPAAVILAMYVAVGRKRGLGPDQLGGTLVQRHALRVRVPGHVVLGVEGSLKLTVDIVEFCARHMPKFYPFNIRASSCARPGPPWCRRRVSPFPTPWPTSTRPWSGVCR